ncbi:hypothetical protein L7F22_022404 [Adiantum nelumboides]|nr:hypothetical protein [Adiantum nelumboides]
MQGWETTALKEEVDKILNAGFIVPVDNAEWVSPVVVTPKKDGRWRVCIDYKPLNAVTKMDPYPLPFIDRLLDAVAGFERYSVCDGHSSTWVGLCAVLLTYAAFLPPSSHSASFSPDLPQSFWASQSTGNYTFGFKNVGTGAYLLSIWHSSDVTQTPIWWASDSAGNAVFSRRAVFNYTSSGILQATSREHYQNAVWETFRDQRDSLMLAGLKQIVVRNKPYLLQSRSSQASYATGRFYMATYSNYDINLYGRDALNNQYAYVQKYELFANVSRSGGFVGLRDLGTDPESERLNPCGPFGICSVNAAMNVSCSCPPGYIPVSSEDYSNGCSSTRSPPGCSEPIDVSTDRVVMEVQPHTDYYYNDLMLLTDFDLEQCKNSCLSNCACIAASYLESRRSCYLKGNETLGYLSIGLSSADRLTLLMKFSLPAEPAHNGCGQRVVVVAVAVTMGALVLTAVILGFLWRRRCAGSKKLMWCRRTDTVDIRVSSLQQLTFDYQELVDATKKFRILIGEGGFTKGG